jgi:hypothetical protein
LPTFGEGREPDAPRLYALQNALPKSDGEPRPMGTCLTESWTRRKARCSVAETTQSYFVQIYFIRLELPADGFVSTPFTGHCQELFSQIETGKSGVV